MAMKRHKPEEIVAKLRQVEVLHGQGKSMAEAIRAIGVTEVTFYRWRRECGGSSNTLPRCPQNRRQLRTRETAGCSIGLLAMRPPRLLVRVHGATRARTRAFLAHEPLNAVKAARGAVRELVPPDPSRSVGSLAHGKACSHLRHERLVGLRPIAGRSRQPSEEAAPRDTERLAHLRYGPDPSVLGDAGEHHAIVATLEPVARRALSLLNRSGDEPSGRCIPTMHAMGHAGPA